MANALANRLTGFDLRIQRVVAGVTQVDMAVVLGVSRQRVGHIESLLRPTAPSVSRYLDALAELSPGSADPESEEAA